MKYELKQEFDIVAFLRSVDHCRGDVLFEGDNGDRLNLKSQLSKYLFLAVRSGDPSTAGSRISCSGEDGELLSEFLLIPE